MGQQQSGPISQQQSSSPNSSEHLLQAAPPSIQLDLQGALCEAGFTIAPNGSIILYATQKGVRGVLGGVTLDGNVKFILPSASGDVREPAWSPYLQ